MRASSFLESRWPLTRRWSTSNKNETGVQRLGAHSPGRYGRAVGPASITSRAGTEHVLVLRPVAAPYGRFRLASLVQAEIFKRI